MISFTLPDTIEALNGGLFISPGFGTHAVRVIDSYELLFVTQGSLDFFEGERTYHPERDQVLLLQPGILHGGLRPYRPDLNFYWAHFRLRPCASPDESLVIPAVSTARDPERLTELFCRFISDQESRILDSCSASQLIALMLCILDGRGRARPRGRRRPVAARGDLVDAVHRFIDGAYRTPISTSSVARAVGFNADYLERVFRRREDMSIVDAIHQKRIAMARASLNSDPRKNINEIAFECGYADPGYFRRMFRRLTGLTPREFRSLYARTHINTH